MTNTVKSALYTFLWTFIGLFGVTLLGWFQVVGEWASKHGHEPFPDVSVLGYGLVSAAGAAAAGLVAFIVRFAQTKNVLPGEPPAFPTTPDA